jgi:multicomponent Na+:H+ antiporter subunit G
MTLVEFIVSALLLAGAAVMLMATTGLLRFSDIYLRMHAATKSSTLGVGCIVVGVGLYFSEPLITIKLLALSAIYFFAAATGAQVLASASHAARVPMAKETWIDELAEREAPDAPTEPLPPAG